MINSDFKEEFNVWGRTFTLDVSLSCHTGQGVLDSQVNVYNNIKNNINELYEVCKTKILEYVNEEEQKELFSDKEMPENIFKYIIPKAIIVTRHTDVDYFGFLFYFRYDRENDICVSFKDYKFFNIGPYYSVKKALQQLDEKCGKYVTLEKSQASKFADGIAREILEEVSGRKTWMAESD